MKSFIRFVMAIPLLSLFGYLFFLGYTGQWVNFCIIWLAMFIIVLIIFNNDPWDKS